ncbi:hypothetical protein Tco_0898414 [Tanacetum coccineum]
MHNNIMVAGSRDRPPMLATGRYAQWKSRFLRYINTRPNGDVLRKCILQGPYIPSIVIIPAAHTTDDSPAVPERTTIETILNISHASTKYKGKEIAKPITPLSESASEEDSNLEQAQRDKNMQKNLALIAKYFKKIYKPTNNLRTSLNSRNKNVDTSPRKPKRVKDYTYHKENMLLCKQAEKGVPLQAEQADWLEDIDEEIDEQELEAHYSYMAKILEVPTTDSGTDTEPLEKVQYDAEYNVFANERQHSE